MASILARFESIARRSISYTEARIEPAEAIHPFDERNIHPLVEAVSKRLFDDGHYPQATFEAYKLLDKQVQRLAASNDSGKVLMMKAFSEVSPVIRLNSLTTQSERDEQEGYKFVFAGSIMAIRNPRGHEVGLKDSPSECLDHLSLASLLFRRLEERMP